MGDDMVAGLEILWRGGAAPRRADDGDIVYYEPGMRTWYRVFAQEVEDLGQRVARGQRDAYSRWCAEITSETVPADEAEFMPSAN